MILTFISALQEKRNVCLYCWYEKCVVYWP